MAPEVEEALATLLAVDDLDELAVLVQRLEDSLQPADSEQQASVVAAWRTEIGSQRRCCGQGRCIT